MSQFQEAFQYTMLFEDRYREYAVQPDPGGFAISGINSAAFPDEFARIQAIPQSERGPSVEEFYQSKFWTPMKIGGINDQDLANRVFDMGVNGGSVEAVQLLQQAVGALRHPVTVDGHIGPETLQAVDECEHDAILAAYRQQRQDYYKAVVVKNPDKAKYLKGWLRRAIA